MKRLRSARRRGGLKGELALAVPPTLVVLAVIFLIEGFSGQRLLFASLAASAFLIYYDPMHRMNTIAVMVSAQLIGFVSGLSAMLILGPGYVAGAVAMSVTIVALILLDVVHPPAVSTALAFAFVSSKTNVLLLFLLAVGLIAILAVLQRTAVHTLRRIGGYVEHIEHEYREKLERVYDERIHHRPHAAPVVPPSIAPRAEESPDEPAQSRA